METVTVHVGAVCTGRSGIVQDDRRPVAFEGEELGGLTTYGTDRRGGLSDTRGLTETLYKTEDRLVVYSEDWTRWQGETSRYALHQVTPEDLGPGGRYDLLGAECGFGAPMTLDQALRPPPLDADRCA